MNNEDWMEHPVGVGPYKITWEPDTTNTEITRSGTFWRDYPLILDGISIPFVGDLQTQLIMYENSEADILFADPARQPSVHLSDSPFHEELRPVKGSGIWYFALDSTSPPFDDIKVRAAMSHALEMEIFIKAVFGPKAAWGRGIISPQLPCHQNPSGYTYQPEMAKQLLAESSYGSAENLPPITLSLSRPSFVRIGELVQEQWNDVLGVQINLIRLEPGQQAPEGPQHLPAEHRRPRSGPQWDHIRPGPLAVGGR